MKKIFALTLILLLSLSLFVVQSSAEEYIDRSGWTLKASSEFSGWGVAARMADGDPKTYWHTKYVAEGSTITSKDEVPHTVEITFSNVESISAMEYLPRQDELAGRWMELEIYASESGTDKGLLIKKESFDHTNATLKRVDLGKTVKAKKVTLVITKSVGSFGTCAEINFLRTNAVSNLGTSDEEKKSDKETVKLDKTTWELKACSEMNGWGFVARMADGNPETYWHTKYVAEGSTITSKDEAPHTVEITFPKVESINVMEYLPRQGELAGRWMELEIYASESGADKGSLIKKVSLDHTDATLQQIGFGKTIKAKKVTLIITKSVGSFGSCAEIDFLYKADEVSVPLVEEENPYPEKFNTSSWIITASSEKNWGKVTKAFDGDLKTYWHTNYEEEDGEILGHDMPPYEIDITLPRLTVITGFKATPRSDQTAGRIKSYRLYASREDDDEWTLLIDGTLNSAIGTEVMDFACGIEVKRIRFEVLEGQSGYATLAELEFIPGKEDTKVVPYEDFDRAMNENKLHKIDSSTIKAENDLPAWSNQKAGAIVNGGVWQTEEIKDDEPVVITVDLGEVKRFSAISILPRQSKDYHGYWDEFTVWASEDGNDYFEIVKDYSFPERNLDEKFIYFDKSVTARYVEIEVTKYHYRRVSCQGLYFWQSYEDMKKSEDGGKFTMQIGSNEIKVEKDGESYTKTIDVAPYITSAGSTLIPLRGLLEEMGAEIAWDGEFQKIKVTKGILRIELQIQNVLVYVDDPAYGYTMYTLNSAPRIKDSRTFIPVRFVSEMLGYNVSWDGVTKTITIEK